MDEAADERNQMVCMYTIYLFALLLGRYILLYRLFERLHTVFTPYCYLSCPIILFLYISLFVAILY